MQHLPADEPFFREWKRARAQNLLQGRQSQRSLERALALRNQLGLPETLPVPTLMVVGSKGKGTAAAAASWMGQTLGRVGTITSPALRTNRERVRLDGRELTDQQYRELSALLADNLRALGEPPAGTYLSPAGAYLLAGIRFLLDQHRDLLVLEEGMGGSSDELSLFTPHLVCLTSVFLEHRDYLGQSVPEIAADLLGVAKPPLTGRIVTFSDQVELAASLTGLPVTGVPRRVGKGGSLHRDNLQLGVMAAKSLDQLTNQGENLGVATPTQMSPQLAANQKASPSSGVPSKNPCTNGGTTKLAHLDEAPEASTVVVGSRASQNPEQSLSKSLQMELRQADLLQFELPYLNLPGRGSLHRAPSSIFGGVPENFPEDRSIPETRDRADSPLVLVEAAINPEGVRAALDAAATKLGASGGFKAAVPELGTSDSFNAATAEPGTPGIFNVAASFPDGKDVAGCWRELESHRQVNQIVWMQPDAPHLRYSRPGIAVAEGLARLLTDGLPVVAVGTISFVSEVLDFLHADTSFWW